ncbi:MAG: response regulator [Chitinophagaceae bacterium]|nr:MAG: response regulator [Chitinophagaceae bacterium]
MGKLKVAILEDNKELLKDLKENLDETNLVEVVAWASKSEELLEKVKNAQPEALILDIELIGDSMSGLDVAQRLDLPVLFVSGKTKDYYRGIEDLNISSAKVIEHITKPITLDKLKKILPKFIKSIQVHEKLEYVFLNFEGERNRTRVPIDSIVCLETDTGSSGKSNNKTIYFTDRKPKKLIDFSFTKMPEVGFDETIFIKPHQSYRVNVSKIIYSNRKTNELGVQVCDESEKIDDKVIPISENFRKHVPNL